MWSGQTALARVCCCVFVTACSGLPAVRPAGPEVVWPSNAAPRRCCFSARHFYAARYRRMSNMPWRRGILRGASGTKGHCQHSKKPGWSNWPGVMPGYSPVANSSALHWREPGLWSLVCCFWMSLRPTSIRQRRKLSKRSLLGLMMKVFVSSWYLMTWGRFDV